MADFREILSRVSIQDILERHGIQYRGRRCRCPFHSGSNTSAFSFTDWGFNCFSCGARGGKLDLIEQLSNVYRDTARRILCEEIAGVPYPSSKKYERYKKDSFDFQFNPHGPPIDFKAERLRERLSGFGALKSYYTRRLQRLRRLLKDDSTSLIDFYTQTQFCDHILEDIDLGISIAVYELHQREGSR
ncbi:MAG: hypothetical protein IIB00_02270 [candidate division Zixibacteria bacterium]|nr:hypothetical protein [candidate division Zixibacteria bacterium]